jgi:hypothetical protein
MFKINEGSNFCLILNDKCVIIKSIWRNRYDNIILNYFGENYFLNPDNLTIIYNSLELLFNSIKHKMKQKNNIYKYKSSVKYLDNKFKIALETTLKKI